MNPAETIRGALAANISRIRRQVGSASPKAFAQTYLGEHFKRPASRMHHELWEQLSAISERREGRLAVAAPRGHAKSTLVSLAYVLWSILTQNEKLVLLVSANKELAGALLKPVKDQLQHNPLLIADFPEACNPPGSRPAVKPWQANKIFLPNGAAVVAVGTEQRVRGLKSGATRPTLIIADDLEKKETVSSDEGRQKLRDWFFSTLLKVGDSQTNVVVVGTVLHYDSLMAHLLDPHKSPGWTTRRYQAVESFAAHTHLWDRWESIFRGQEEHEGRSGPEAAVAYFEVNKASMLEGTKVLWPELEDYSKLMVIKQAGVEVRYVTENFTGGRTDDLLRPVKQWQAREESKDLSKVTIRGLLSKSSTGAWMGGVPPHGYDLRYESASGEFLTFVRHMPDGSKQLFDQGSKLTRVLARGESLTVSRKDRCTLVLGEASRQDAVREIFRLYVEEGRGFKAVADALNRAGVAAPRDAGWREGMSGKWSVTTVRAILINPAYTGDLEWNRRTDARFHRIVEGRAIERGDVYSNRLEANAQADWITVPDAHPPIVSRRVFELAQAKMQEREASKLQRGINPRTGEAAGLLERASSTGGWTGPKAKYLLGGLITCARCGSRYEGHSQYRQQRNKDGKRKITLGYACGGYIRHGRAVCSIGRVAKDQLESLVVAVVVEYYGALTGKNARERIAKLLQVQMGGEAKNVDRKQLTLRGRLEQIDLTVRNLLDNITAANRDAADKRLLELAGERRELQEAMEDLRGLALSAAQMKELVEHTARFVAGLPQTLDSNKLDQRQAAVRRCVERITIDHAVGEVNVALRRVPLVAGGASAHDLEHIKATLSIFPAARDPNEDAHKSQ